MSLAPRIALAFVVFAAACTFESHSIPRTFGDGEDGDGELAPDAAPAEEIDADLPAPPPPPPPSPDGAPPGPLLPFGAPCESDAQCAGNLCERFHGEHLCTQSCDDESDCPPGADGCDDNREICLVPD